jgi:hypothetical protein
MLNLTLAVVENAMGESEEELEAEQALEAENKKPEDEAAPRQKGGLAFLRPLVEGNEDGSMTYFEIFVTLAVLANTVVMAMEMYEPLTTQQNNVNQATDGTMSWETRTPAYVDSYAQALETANDIFTFVFLVELLLKLPGLGPREYFSSYMNMLDFVVTIIPLIEFIMKNTSSSDTNTGLGALRCFRLFRLFKLARAWKSLQQMLVALVESIQSASSACLLLLIIMFIFTLLGIQMFENKMATCLPVQWRMQYAFEKPALLNEAFVTNPKGFMANKTRITAAELGDPLGCPLDAGDAARGHFDYFWWSFVTVFQVLTGENWNEVLYFAIDGTGWWGASIYFIALNVVGQYVVFNIFLAILLGNMEGGDDDGGDDEAAEDKYQEGGAKVLPEGETVEKEDPNKMQCKGNALCILGPTNPVRLFFFKIAAAPAFDNFILFLIGLSSLMLAVDQPFLENCKDGVVNVKYPNLATPNDSECEFQQVLAVVDLIVTILFIIEMVIKIIGLGFGFAKHTYLGNSWNRLDFFIVVVSIINLILGDNDDLAALKSLRALRALRPLRLLSRYPGMQLVVGSILEGLPEIIQVTVVCLLFYLIIAIVGVQNWKGALNMCTNGDKVCHPNVAIVMTEGAEHPALTCCDFPLPKANDDHPFDYEYSNMEDPWADRKCTQCKKEVDFPHGLGCGPAVGCGFGDGNNYDDMYANMAMKDIFLTKKWETDTTLWTDISSRGVIDEGGDAEHRWFNLDGQISGGVFHVAPGGCGSLSNTDDIAECEELSYCDLFDADTGVSKISDAIAAPHKCYHQWNGTDYTNKPYPEWPSCKLAKDAAAGNNGERNAGLDAACAADNRLHRFHRPEFAIPERWLPMGAIGSVNFDTVWQSLLAVFECSSGEMWPNIMYAVQDSVGPDQPATFENSWLWVPWYFILIQLLCAFLLLNLFVGVLVEQYNAQKDGEGGPMITEKQKEWIETQKLALDCAPERKVVPPQASDRRQLFQLVESRGFELFIMSMIMLNVVFMMMNYFGQDDGWQLMLSVANYIFCTVFTIEAILKLYALGPTEYFARNWNRFDFTIVVLSWVGIVANLGSLATLLRVARIARIFRLVQTSPTLSTLFNTLMTSIPAIGNVASVTMLLLFVYAVLGMNLFSKIKLGENLTPHANFKSFFGSLMLLFRMSTGESYNGVMHDCKIAEPFCSPAAGDCGQEGFAELYFLSFFIFSAMLMLNILVAIILDNYGDQEDQSSFWKSVGPEDMQVFKQVWAEKDPTAKGYINADDLEWLICHLPAPLGLAHRMAVDTDQVGMAKQARNKMKSLDMVLECNGKVFFHHVLKELVKTVHGEVDMSNLKDNPRMEELENKAKHSKFEKKANTQKKKMEFEPASVAESTASLRLQTAWRGKMCRKEMPGKAGGAGSVTAIDADKSSGAGKSAST